MMRQRTFETWDAALYFANLMARRHATRARVHATMAGWVATDQHPAGPLQRVALRPRFLP